MSCTKYIINIKNANYKNTLKDLNLKVKKNSFLTILGENGSGKSQLCEYISDTLDKSCFLIINENDYLFLSNSIIDELKIYNYSKDPKNIEKILKYFSCFSLLNKNINKINKSARQILIVLEALLSDYKILIFDDCLSNINPYIKNIFMKKLYKYSKIKNITVINITNDSSESIYGDDIAIIKHGHIIENSTKFNVYNKTNLFKENNIKLPFIVDISNKLSYYNLINKIILDKTELVNKLWK